MMGEVIRVSGRAPDVGDLLREAMVSQRFADVALCCSGGQRFLAHRLVLSAASPYLQKVLLAHGKVAGYCERITVILAEVEGPELAAILGFVYTGSATIPRSRLEAFTRAAETLQLRIPKFGNRRSVNECKLDNVKIEETKIDTRYLGCEQYPADDKSFESTGWPFDACMQRRDWLAMENPGLSSIARRSNNDSTFLLRDATALRRSCLERNENTKLRERQIFRSESWMESNSPFYDETIADRTIGGSRSEDGSCDDYRSRLSRRDVSRVDDNSVSRMSVESVSRRWDEATKIQHVEGVTKQRDNNDFEGRLAESVPSLPLVHRTTGRSSVTFEKQDYDAAATVTVASGSVPTTATVTSNIATSSPICGESCCRWTTPRRHVANRVPASPWIQLAKPAHHSPKIQPIVLRNREEIVEAARPDWNGLTSLGGKHSSPFPSLSPNLHHPPPPIVDCSLYDLRVCANAPTSHLRDSTNYQSIGFPIVSEGSAPRTAIARIARASSLDDSVASSPDEGTSATAAIAQPRGVLSQRAIVPEARELAVNEPTPPCDRQASPRVELSHPISRLCDTVSFVDDSAERDKSAKDNYSTSARKETIKLNEEEISTPETKLLLPPSERIVRSDNNNNEADSPIPEISRNFSTAPCDAITASEEHRCEQCGKTFVTRASLKVHGRTHSGEKPFRCNDCGKEFSQLRNYKYHRSVHEGTREFAATCPECGKYFNDRGYLSSHMKIHRNRKEYACAECGKSFNQRVAYNMHVRIHTGVKPHQCEECGKAFSRKMLLKQHLRTHSGERPYQCEICHKAFADRSNMTLHTRLHSGLKPYQCTLCTKAFTKKHHLKTHLNYHTGTKPYSCPNCSLRFSQSSNMRTHYKKCTAAGGGGGVGGNSAERSSPRGSDNNSSLALVAPSALVPLVAEDEKPTTGRTNALTPPSSDQESSAVLAPSEKRKSNRIAFPPAKNKQIPDT